MLLVIKACGVLMVVMGLIFVFAPQAMKSFMAFMKEGNRLYGPAVLRVVMGIIFLFAASQARQVGIILTLGILMLLGGILIFVMGMERCKSILRWWEEKPLLLMRLIAILPIAIGILILYSA